MTVINISQMSRLISFVVLFPVSLYAQINDPQFDFLTVEDGLSTSYVSCITQDHTGFIWIGTEDGLNRYDGYKFIVYKHFPFDSSGVSDNLIKSLYVDRNGYLWIGTGNGGLNRYDPEMDAFLIFRYNPDEPNSISSNTITAICQDRTDNLWIGTEGEGLNRLKLNDGNLNSSEPIFERFYNQPGDPNTISGESITSLFGDSQGNIWVGTTCGLSRLDINRRDSLSIKNFRFESSNSNSLSNNNISDICEDNSGNIWIGTKGGGLNRLNPTTEKFDHYRYEPQNDSSLSNDYVTKVCLDRYNNNILWIGTLTGGLNKLHINSFQMTRYEISSDFYMHGENYILDVFQDASGLLWLGTWAGGLGKYDPRYIKFRKFSIKYNNESGDIIDGIYENPISGKKDIWLVSAGGGVLKFDLTTGSYKRYLYNPSHPDFKQRNLFICVYGEPKINIQNKCILWLGGQYQGLATFDTETMHHKFYEDDHSHILSNISYRVRYFYPDPVHHGIIWIGTNGGGLYRYDKRHATLKQYTYSENNTYCLSHPFVHHILKDKAGNLWISTLGGGLNKMDEESERFFVYKHNPEIKKSISHDFVTSVYESSKGEFWVGTRGGGLNKFDRQSGEFKHFTERDGLPSNTIFGILEDGDSNIWLTTTKGISKFDPRDTTQINFENFDAGDGLHYNEMENNCYLKNNKGEFFLGGKFGFTFFHPDQIVKNTNIPEILITDFYIHNNRIEPGRSSPLKKMITQTKEIVLIHNQNTIGFEFAALDYSNPLKNKYAYKLDGVDPDWIYTNASYRIAGYTLLDPGTYMFHVKGSNNDGIWNEKGTSIRIIILPPWWKTTWAYFLYVFFIVAVIYSIWRFQSNKLKMKHQLEIELLHCEKLEEVDQMKSRFFANISHEFRTPLTLILGPVQSVLSKIGDIGLKNELNIVLRNVNRLERLINQLLDLSRLEAGKMELKVQEVDIIPLLRKLVLAFTSLAERKEITLKFKCKTKTILTFIDLDKIEKIMNNLLSNAFKFTPKGGVVEVAVENKPTPLSPPRRGIISSPSREARLATGQGLGVGKELSNHILISITNTGPGIPPDQLDKIFDRFYSAPLDRRSLDNRNVDDGYPTGQAVDHYQIEPAPLNVGGDAIQNSERYTYPTGEQGSGIGLALVKELVELHHGTIHVQCKRKGTQSLTTFTILVPLSREQYSEDEIIDARLVGDKDEIEIISKGIEVSDQGYEEQEDTEILASPKTLPLVLLIEDNPDMRTYIRDHLKSYYRIVVAADGEKGWYMAKRRMPDLIISDIMMPKMDGFKVCQKIKSDISTSHIPLILLTARAELKDKLAGLELGADDYIPKPFAIEELQVRIKNLIEQRQKLRERFSNEALFGIQDMSFNQTDEQFLQKIIKVINQHISDPHFTVQVLSAVIGMNQTTLNQKLKALTGQSPHNFIRLFRLKKAAVFLRQKTVNVTEVAYEVGYKSLSHFSKAFQNQFGDTPSHFSAYH